MRRKGRGKADKKEKQREAMAHLWVGEAHRLALEVEASHFLRRADVALGVVLERSVLAALIKKKRNETKRNETKRNVGAVSKCASRVKHAQRACTLAHTCVVAFTGALRISARPPALQFSTDGIFRTGQV